MNRTIYQWTVGLWVVGMCLLLSSCLKEGGGRIVLPVRAADIPTEVLAEAERLLVEEYMPIYTGDTPPAVSGCFTVAPERLVWASDSVEGSFFDFHFCLDGHNFWNRINYTYRQGTAEGEGDVPWIIGEDDKFTLWLEDRSVDAIAGWSSRTVTVLSGRWREADSSIADCRVAVLMREKRDAHGMLAAPGCLRIFADGDRRTHRAEEGSL
mgnify:CR=1 FL=1